MFTFQEEENEKKLENEFAKQKKPLPAIIKVVGIGGAGMNAVERMVALNIYGVDLIAINTDKQVLEKTSIQNKILVGEKITRGLGAGADPNIGEKSALEDKDKIVDALKDADMVFITAGIGKGTGTGVSPIVAEISKEIGALTVGIVSLPFSLERKEHIAQKGIEKLRSKVDTLITIPNDDILKVVSKKTTIDEAYKELDNILAQSAIGISQIVNMAGHINVDFADLRTIMSNNGDAMIGLGEGFGDKKVETALENAINHPLLENRSIDGASSVLVNIVANSNFSMCDYQEILSKISQRISTNVQNTRFIHGIVYDNRIADKLQITIIATGFHFKKDNKSLENPNRITDSQSQKSNILEYPYHNETKSSYKTEQPSKPLNFKDMRKENNKFPKNSLFPDIHKNIQDFNIPAFIRKYQDNGKSENTKQ